MPANANNKKTVSKWVRIAVEGATTDGRNIERSWIEQMAKNYNRQVYGARLNLEHIKGIYPDSIFKAYGDVIELKSEQIADGPLSGKVGLYAKIEPTDDLIELNRKKQKVYSSIEISHKFADTDEAYLIGVGLTDNPASLGTEFLQFSANAAINPLNARKQDPNNLFSSAEETTIEFEEIEENQKDGDNKFTSMINQLKQLFTKNTNQNSAQFMQLGEVVGDFFTASTEQFNQLIEQLTQTNQELDEAKQQIAEFKNLLSSTSATSARPLSSGGTAESQHQTDC